MANDSTRVLSALLLKRKQLHEIQREMEALQRAELVALPRRVGVETIDELIRLLLPLASAEFRMRSSGSSTPRKRAVVTEKMRKMAIEELAQGKMAASEIASRVGVSTSFINKLKAEQGLTRPLRSRRK